jgi:hypothetical protein
VGLTLDPQVAIVLEKMVAAMGDVVHPPAGDVEARRPVLEGVMAQTAAMQISSTT